jgi:hypothetical protein
MQNKEDKIRKLARRHGFALRKSRGFRPINDMGLFRIVDPYSNVIVAGERFDLSLDEVREFLLALE